MKIITVTIIIGLITMIGWNIIGIIKDIKKKKKKEVKKEIKDDNIN